MRRLLIVLLLALVATIPAMAQDYTYTAPTGYCVWKINFDIPDGSAGTIIMSQANGQTVTASWTRSGFPLTHVGSQIGSDSESFDIYPYLPVYGSIWNGENTTNNAQLKMGTGPAPGGWARVIQTSIDPAVITSYRLISDQEISISEDLLPTSKAIAIIGENNGTGIGLLDLLKSAVPLIVNVFLSLIYWLKYLFIDNLVLVVCLYLTGSMAYAINTSRNIFSFYKTWFKQQAALFNFIANGFDVTFRIVTQVAAIVTTPVGAAAVIIGAAILWLSTMW